MKAGDNLRFEFVNGGGWYVRIFCLGPVKYGPANNLYYQVNVYDGANNLVTDKNGFVLEIK